MTIFSIKKQWSTTSRRSWRLGQLRDEVGNRGSNIFVMDNFLTNTKRMPPFWFAKGLKVGASKYLEVT